MTTGNQNLIVKTTNSAITQVEPDKKLLAVFWKRMTQAYGSVWINQYGEVPNRTWENLIGTLTRGQIENGVKRDGERIAKRVKEGLTSYPPSVDEFKAMCLQVDRPESGAYRIFAPEKRIEQPLDKEAGLLRLSQLREALGL